MADGAYDRNTIIGQCYNIVTHMLLSGLTFICCHFAFVYGLTPSFRQHIILCVIGYILLMSEAVMTFSEYNGWSKLLQYQHRRLLHGVLQCSGSVLAIAGSIIRMQAMQTLTGRNFATVHGILGLIALILTFATLLGGVANFFIANNNKFIKICHSCAGILTLFIAFITLCVGLDKLEFRAIMSHSTANTMIAFAVFAVFGVILSACMNIRKRMK